MEQRGLKILIVEDDPLFREQVKELLGVYNEVFTADGVSTARKILSEKSINVLLLDKKLPDGNGVDLIPWVKAEFPRTVILIITADSDYHNLNGCMALGAHDYIQKTSNVVPEILTRIPLAISRADLERKSSDFDQIFRSSYRYEIIGSSNAMNQIRMDILSMKGKLSHVIVTGETGTGKELVAHRLNVIEEGKNRPFVVVNCAAIPEELIESEFFGHKRGSFTGAQTDKIGKFQLASGGDLFLDEVAELPLRMQAKLLRVLQEGEFTPIGSNQDIRVNVRVIAATNRPIEEWVRQGKFREDLYFRLNVFRLQTTPLRERKTDIPDLARFFLLKSVGHKASITDGALRLLEAHDWPGNIRELKNCIERSALAMQRRESKSNDKKLVIEPQDILFDELMVRLGRDAPLAHLQLPSKKQDITANAYINFIEDAERTFISRALDLCDGSASEVAPLLGLARSTIFKKLHQFGLMKKSSKSEESNEEHL